MMAGLTLELAEQQKGAAIVVESQALAGEAAKIVCPKRERAPRWGVLRHRRLPERSSKAALSYQKLERSAAEWRRQQLDPLVAVSARRDELGADLTAYKDAIVTLMSRDPQSAMELLPSRLVWEIYREISEHCFPTPAQVVEGTIEAIHFDDWRRRESVTQHWLRDASGRRYALHLARLGDYLETGTKVRLRRSFQLDDEILVGDYAVVSQPGNPPAVGQRRMVVALAQPAIVTPYDAPRSLPPPTLTREGAAELVFGRLNDFYQRTSFQQLAIVGENFQAGSSHDVVGPVPVTFTVSSYHCSGPSAQACIPGEVNVCQAEHGFCDPDCGEGFFEPIYQQVLSAADAVAFENYDHLLIILPDLTLPCGWGGASSLGKLEIQHDGGTLYLSVSIIMEPPAFLDVSVTDYIAPIAGHEVGHAFGLAHAAFFTCPDPLDYVEECFEEYGDWYDIMGSGAFYHNNAVMKDHAGWLTPQGPHQILTIEQSGTYTLQPLGSPGSGLKGIRIPHAPAYLSFPFLYLEYRQVVEQDTLEQNLRDDFSARGTPTDIFKGALLHFGGRGSGSILYDPKVRGSRFATTLRPGETFADIYSGTRITVNPPTPDGLSVVVALGRTDFSGPENLRLTNASNPDTPCQATYFATAQDPSGISKIAFLVREGNNIVEHLLAERTQLPAEITLDLAELHNRNFWFRAYDNAIATGGTFNNYTNAPEVALTAPNGCFGLPEVTISSPQLGQAFSSAQQEPDGFEALPHLLRGRFTLDFPQPVSNPVRLDFIVADAAEVDAIELIDLNTPTVECVNYFHPPRCSLYVRTTPPSRHTFTVERAFNAGQHTLLFYVSASPNRFTEVTIRFDVLPPPSFRRGDANADGAVNISDAVFLLANLFQGGAAPTCDDAADSNDDGSLDVSDVARSLLYLFGQQGIELAAPGPTAPGPDPTADGLGCAEYPIP